MLTLWDLLDPLLTKLLPAKPVQVAPLPKPKPAPTSSPAQQIPAQLIIEQKPVRKSRAKKDHSADATMQAKYDRVVREMLAEYKIRVRKWRTSMSGIAWYVKYRDGSIQRLIESPKPKGPMSMSIFLHEIGHHAIGFNTYKPRCLEEFHAWRWSLEAMEAKGLNITDPVRLRMHRSLYYAVMKAKRRGIKAIPPELEPFCVKPPPRKRRGV